MGRGPLSLTPAPGQRILWGRATRGEPHLNFHRSERKGGPKVLTIDVGGSNVKILATDQRHRRKIPSGPDMSADQMVAAVLSAAEDWTFEAISLGFPGPVRHGHPLKEPDNLGFGWVGYDFEGAFGHPVKVINDAAMQALGSFQGGRMLFLGLGTGLGSAMVADGIVLPMELTKLPYKHGRSYGDYLAQRGLKRQGKSKWRQEVLKVIPQLRAALQADYVVLGGGNVKQLRSLPPYVRVGSNHNAFIGGFRLWEDESIRV